jgi:pimeloyl-ACP methyl ester carboxylesterase
MATRMSGRFSRRLGGALAARLWFTPWAVDNNDRARARHARWLEGTRPATFRFREETLAGFTAGEGPTILLVHGWGERAATLGALVHPLVARGYRVVGVDLPAHGDSPGRRTNMLEEAAALIEIEEQLGDIYAVVAHSMGSAVTTIAIDEGLAPRHVVAIGPAVRLEHALHTFAELWRIPPKALDGLRRRIERRFGATVWEDLAADHLVQRFELPALIIHDAEDDQVAFSDGERLASRWPGARFVATEGLGHVKVLGNDGVIDEIARFLARKPALV